MYFLLYAITMSIEAVDFPYEKVCNIHKFYLSRNAKSLYRYVHVVCSSDFTKVNAIFEFCLSDSVDSRLNSVSKRMFTLNSSNS